MARDAARDQMRAFEAAGYVEPGGLAHGAGDDWWATTVKGNALANASFGKPISRATATRLLGQVIERARAYNADPAPLLTVTEIVVFGSYLGSCVRPARRSGPGCLDCAPGYRRTAVRGQGPGVRQSQRPRLQRIPCPAVLARPRAADDLEEPVGRDQHHRRGHPRTYGTDPGRLCRRPRSRCDPSTRGRGGRCLTSRASARR